MESFVNKHRASHATVVWSQNISANHSHQPTSTLFTNLFTSMFCFQQKANEYSRETNIIKDLFSPFQNMCSSNQISKFLYTVVCLFVKHTEDLTATQSMHVLFKEQQRRIAAATELICWSYKTKKKKKKVLGYGMVQDKVKLNSHLRIQVRITYK